jgi:hypothetical protein
MRYDRVLAQGLLGAALLGTVSPPAAGEPQIPQGWEIVEIFPAGTEYDCGPPDINDRGAIVFHRRLWPSLPQIEIMLYDRGKLTQLTDDNIRDVFPRINNHGHIVWSRDIDEDGRLRIVRWTDGTAETVSNPAGPFADHGADINDSGHVVWSRSPMVPPDNTEIFLFNGVTTQRITDDTFSNQTPRINVHAEFVFTQYNFYVSPWVSDIFGYFNRRLRRLSNAQDTLQYPDINDHRQVVWHGASSGVSLWDNGITTTIIATNAGGAHINNVEDICFSRRDFVYQEGEIWLWRQGKLLQLTDGSFGGNFSALNNRGEIAFQYGRVRSYGIALFTRRCFQGDFDSDGDRDLRDFAILQRNFGSQDDAEELCPLGDMTADGCVGMEDYEEFALWFGGIWP